MQNSSADLRYCWNAGLVPLIAASGGMGLLLEERQYLISDALVQHLIRLLQQPQSLESLVQQSCPAYDLTSVQETVAELLSKNIVVPSRPHTLTRNLAAFWDKNPGHFSNATVKVESLLPNFAANLEALLQANGVPQAAEADLTVLITDDYLRREVSQMAASRDRMLLAKPVGNEVWIGPCLSKETAMCWNCLAYWLRLRRWPEFTVTGIEPEEPAPSTSVAWLPSTLTLASGLIATAATLGSAGQTPGEGGPSLWVFDLHNLQGREFPMAARRNCPACGPQQDSSEQGFLAALQSPKTGILDRIRVSDGRAGFVHLVNASVLMPLPQAGCRALLPPLAGDGKGVTVEEALQRCTMEAVERFSSIFTGDEALLRGSLKEVGGIAPDELSHFSEAQFRSREEWNRSCGEFDRIPEKLNPDRPTRWVAARKILHQEQRYVPAGYAYLGYPFDDEDEYHYADTNGCAAGDSYEGATLRGLLELIERDALAIWWYNRIRRPGVDLAAWNDEEVQEARSFFAGYEQSLELLDLTHDLGIPVFAAVSANARGGSILFGCGAHVCAERAAKRALAELLQFWYWTGCSGADADRQRWLDKSSLSAQTYLRPRSRAEIPRRREMDAASALRFCVAALKTAGVEAYVIDLTRPELAIPVVRVVAPGLRHYGPRFAPGRLYDVPVRLGWVSESMREKEVNPDVCVL